jgi:adenosylhomocysteine nucleosidase
MMTPAKTQAPRPVFIAAMHREIAALTKSPSHNWSTDASLRKRNIYLYWNDHAVIACAGMGADRARLALDAAMQLGPVSELFSIGWAGSCSHRAVVGQVLHPEIIVDTKTGERFFTVEAEAQAAHKPHQEPVILITVPTPAGVKEKQYLAMSYYAQAVDMEAASLARVARAHDIPFRAIKAISDAHDFELPDLAPFTTADGQFREAAFGIHVVTHPALWKTVRTMATGSTLAAQHLRQAIESEIQAHILKTGRDHSR